ncbi:peptidoglycan editing factor PgeF [Paenibacillus protaetiae]|uniref:Purine nucleoside phosphorylase n=1 Tax=Paenibacillus protaetiae TaxID=2509456 RepID=A0A4P6EUW0_9BACL|nr:peptidoglycan editing factor PgeF [Paenibacillus protaetiae]QAY65429.1 peptidoglycan editing factor PgeF [Paenibacillus protaetiae]
MESFQQHATAKEPSLFLLSSWMEQEPGLTAGFTGRSGGVSGSPWTSLNMGLHVGDDEETVARNRRLLAEAIGWPFEAFTCGEQVHGCAVYKVTASDRGKGRLSREDAVPDTDALMTNEPDTLLVSFYADCVPLYFYDAEHRAIALAHAGWKGTVQQIAARTLEAMHEAYGTRPDAVQAAIGPSIGDCCYEVDNYVIDRLMPVIDSFEAGDEAVQRMLRPVPDGKAMVNLKEINRQIMIKAGILPIHIEMSKWCTGCNRDLFFSHRMEGGRTGRMASWIGIRK